MVYRTVEYHGEGSEALKTLLRRLDEIKERNEDIISFQIQCIG